MGLWTCGEITEQIQLVMEWNVPNISDILVIKIF